MCILCVSYIINNDEWGLYCTQLLACMSTAPARGQPLRIFSLSHYDGGKVPDSVEREGAKSGGGWFC